MGCTASPTIGFLVSVFSLTPGTSSRSTLPPAAVGGGEGHDQARIASAGGSSETRIMPCHAMHDSRQLVIRLLAACLWKQLFCQGSYAPLGASKGAVCTMRTVFLPSGVQYTVGCWPCGQAGGRAGGKGSKRQQGFVKRPQRCRSCRGAPYPAAPKCMQCEALNCWTASLLGLTPDTAISPAASFLPACLGSGASSTRRFQLPVLQV